MKILLVAFGSHGDVQPIISLGKGLHEAGYEIVLAAGEDFQQHVEGAGLTFRSIDVNIEAMIKTDLGKEWLDGSSHNPLQELANMRQMAEENTEAINRTLFRVTADADVIISGLLTLPSLVAIGQAHNKPVIASWLSPFPVTRDGRAIIQQPPFPHRTSILNRLYGYVVYAIFWGVFDKLTNQTHQQLGLPPFGRSDFFRVINQTPSICGFSKWVVPRPADWGPQHHITGYWYSPASDDWSPSPELRAFLDAGEPPVYMGFGSMASKNPQATAQLMIDALQQANQRGIILTGWGDLKADDLPESVFLLDYAPHSWLFPQMAGVVHHGGAGTTAAALRAGVPSMIVAHMGDQPYWGQRVFDLGVGAAPLRRHTLTAEKLAQGITTLVTDRQMRQEAAQLGEHLQAETGVANAVAAVKSIVGPN